MRCQSDLTCQIYSGEPAQGAEELGEGTLTVSGSTGTMCLTGRCQPITRCPDIAWTEEERSSGFAERWEAGVKNLQ